MNKKLPQCDIVLPVFNGLPYLKDCITSILKYSNDYAYHLWIVDDCSDNFTRRFLEKQSEEHSQISLHRNPENLGFLRSCNIGISQGSAPYVVLINSDVIVTPGWLTRLIQCAESDSQIASVNPFTNHASNINIPLAPGANFYSMDWLLAQRSPRNYPDVVTGVAFCILLRRLALEEVGLFDEVYGRGYCEDSDLCMRLVAKGYRTVVADNVYVYHKRAASFTDRDERYNHNRKIFDARWANEYKRQFRAFHAADPLKAARDLFRVPQQWDPIPSMRDTYRRMRHCWRRRELLGVVREAMRGLRRLPGAKHDVVKPETAARFTRPGCLRVTYVLHDISIAGGVLSVIQLVNELILLGVEARIATLWEHPGIYNWKFFTKPIIFPTLSKLMENFPESDITVATYWTTAPWVYDLVKSGRGGVGVYFVQDYESWFFPEEDHETRANVKKTYELIPHKIVKSVWLKELLSRDGYDSHKIHLGMDLAMFYPRDVSKPSQPTVLAMARPQTPRRGFPHIVDALRLVKDALPEVGIIFFGDAQLSSQDIPFAYRNEGVIINQNRLAELYSSADVFLDGSNFQGFGRTALEAMACGTACVLTNVGGVNEYARDGENCLLVPPQKPEAFAETIIRIIKNKDLKERIVQGGFETVKDYCHKREAKETLKFFKRIVGWESR